jgi:hypothetical protein
VTRKLVEPLSQPMRRSPFVGWPSSTWCPSPGRSCCGVDRAGDSDLSLWDALIVEAARAADGDVLLTEDLNADQVFGGVQVQNPFVPLEQ